MNKLLIYTDGAARNNPGPAGIGVVFCDSTGEPIITFKEYIGEATNNQAEYKALILALKKVESVSPKSVLFYMDSKLVVEQINGNYKVKNSDLKQYHTQARILTVGLGVPVEFRYISREKNKLADKLANQAIDEYENSKTA